MAMAMAMMMASSTRSVLFGRLSTNDRPFLSCNKIACMMNEQLFSPLCLPSLFHRPAIRRRSVNYLFLTILKIHRQISVCEFKSRKTKEDSFIR
jgi:hypothetical protein